MKPVTKTLLSSVFLLPILLHASHAQIYSPPIHRYQDPEQKPLFGGPPDHSNLPFDVKSATGEPAFMGLFLNQQKTFNMGFHATMHKALGKTQDHSDSDDTDSDSGSSNSDAPSDVNMFHHAVMNRDNWGGALSQDDEKLRYFRRYSMTTFETKRRYGPSLTGETVGLISSGEHKDSLLVSGPENCRYVMKKMPVTTDNGTLDFGYEMEDVNAGCQTVSFPTKIHIDISMSDSILQQHDD